MLLDWLSGTPFANETFLEVLGWIQFAYDCFVVFNVFRFIFHVLRGGWEEFIERSRLMQFVLRRWKLFLAGHLLYCTLRGSYSHWFYVILFGFLLLLMTVLLVLEFLIYRLEKKNQAYRDLLEKESKKEEDEEEDDGDADGKAE